MVRQASCDVSDRNDKGSPDTVWQILGSCRGSFSCSKTSAAQTQDPALASREETLQSEWGGLCQVRERCLLCLFARTHAPVHRPVGQRGSRAAGLTATGTSVLHPQHFSVSSGRDQCVQRPGCPVTKRLTLSIFTPNKTKSDDLVPECSW